MKGSQFAKCKHCGEQLTWVPWDGGYYLHNHPRLGQYWGCKNPHIGKPATYGGDWVEEGTQKRLI